MIDQLNIYGMTKLEVSIERIKQIEPRGGKMSLILKGIDLDTDYGLCILTKSGELITANGKNIQAIQIPKNHGRLIDGDELVKHLRKDPLFDLVERYGISGVIESRPTILEAEE